MQQVEIQYSLGKGKNGRQFAFVRPSGNCSNKSRRVAVEKIEQVIKKYFPVVNYYRIDDLKIGAKDEQFAVKEYYRICEKSKINKPVNVIPLSQ